ncbi:alpha/beta hydrolase [Streptomyces sp. NPDC056224]|uniref:alpha/beta hydrolase n=1 Tax=Streptomyces sp. NPDC056224 TaxID=3345750 RepID=UPI0035E01AB6
MTVDPRGAHRVPASGSRLVVRRVPPRARGAVLLLHGGRSEALEPPPLLDLPAARMRLFAPPLLRAGRRDLIAVAQVRYGHRGWNGEREDALHDAREALRDLTERVGDVPVVLVGHSMGGRAALRLAGHPQVRGVVALAPWCPPGEPVGHLRGRQVAVLHDQHDRVTAAREAWEFLARAERAGATTVAVRMRKGGHTMLRDARTWHRTTASLAVGMLGLVPLPDGADGDPPQGFG